MTSASDVLQKSPIRSDAKSLRAKWGWIVALGAVYLFAGFIALGSVLVATMTSVLVVGLAMIVAGVTEIVNAFEIKSLGKCLFWALLGVFLHRRRFRDIRKSTIGRRAAHACARRFTGRFRHYADHSGIQHEARNTLDLGGVIGHHYADARLGDSGALADQQRLRPGSFPRYRSDPGRRRLDRNRVRLAWPSGTARAGTCSLTAGSVIVVAFTNVKKAGVRYIVQRRSCSSSGTEKSA